MMRCGPAPVKAIKEGNVYLGYDAKFIFAEVNGDKVVWMVKPSGDMYPLKDMCQTHSVGKSISTKAVGSSERNDVTDLYKYPEGNIRVSGLVAFCLSIVILSVRLHVVQCHK